MPISVVCETCGTKLKAPDTAAGKKVKCPKCANLISVPAVGDEASSAPAALPRPKGKGEPLDNLDELPEAGNESPGDEVADEGDAEKNRGPVSQDDMTWGLLAHLAGTFFGWVGALIVFLMKKDESAFLRHHTKEALNFQLTMIPMFILVCLLSCCISCGGSFAALNSTALSLLVKGVATLPLMALSAADVILGIMAALAAKKGEWYKYPFAFRMIK